MGRGFDWIVVENVTVPNLLPLCWRHHEECTGQIGGYRAGIRYDVTEGLLYWVNGDGEQELNWGTSVSADPYVRDELDLCSECGRRKPRKYSEPLPESARAKRPKARVVITVPSDERENGAETLQQLFSQTCELVGRSEKEVYYALVEGLYKLNTSFDLDAEEYDGTGPCPTCGTVLA
jgi:hypothetical protein